MRESGRIGAVSGGLGDRLSSALAEQDTHLSSQLIAVGPTDHGRVDGQLDRGIAVADLGLDVWHVEAGPKHEGDVRRRKV